MNSQTLIQIPDAESVANAKIAAAARLYAAAQIARRDAHGNPHQEAHAEAYNAFYDGQEAAHQALLEACAEPGRDPYPETIRPPWLQDSPYTLVQGQIYHPVSAQPWYVSSDGHLLVAIPGPTQCRASAKRLAAVASVLHAPSSSKWQGDYAEVLSWLVEVCDGPAYQPDPDEPGLWPICAPAGDTATPYRYDGAKLLHCLRELPETGAITVEECEVAAPGAIGPMLRVTSVLGGWIVCLMGLWATDAAREAHPAQPLPLVALERETTARLRDSLSVADQLAGVPRG